MQTETTLEMLPLNQSALIVRIDCDNNIKNRIFDLGISENSVIKPVFKSPFGDPTAYFIKNTLVALRKKDSKKIMVSPL